ncbi:CLUMA_CG015064, isoform A [Clunio marinus]|uniref:CLUMA_CG015064, isoform A n=1 Tax=Clunio marinus TaxID=568069 RepID=A0A1J1IP10_9DIPT|nr:CLUMA_CG015064, isoform A [Clunio marinus]
MESMEVLLNNLLLAENVQKATEELNEALKRPETIQILCEIVVRSANPQLRQYAAVILRKRLVKLRFWNMVPKDQQQLIKTGFLQAITTEQDKSARAAITQVVGALVNHEFPKKDPWANDVLKFVFESSQSSDPAISLLGAETFATLTEAAPDQFIPHLETIGMFCSQAMIVSEQTNNLGNPVVFNLLMAMSHLVPFIIGHNVAEHVFTSSVPYVVKALHAFSAQNDEEKFIDAFDILENLADHAPKLLTNHITLLIEFCLELARRKEVDEGIRVKVITYIALIVRLKKKLILKLKLVEPIIAVLFQLMAAPSDDSGDDTEEYFGSNEVTTPMNCATQTLDTLALSIPPKNLIPPLLAILEPALQSSNDPLQKKAAYLSIAVIAEGCSSAICKKYLRPLLDCIKTGITDQNPIIRNSALFALGQFSEHLQPDISQFSEEVLPILFDYLLMLSNQIRAGGKEPQHIDRVFYAVETFCENLEDALVPHLPVLMERLFDCMAPTNSVHLRELALSAISATSTAAKSNLMPYFPQLIEGLKMYLQKTEDEDICTLRPAAIDTLAALARTIGKENFLPLAIDTMNLGLTLIEDGSDPDLKRSCYNLFASMASILNEQMGSALEKIVSSMIDSVKSTDSIISMKKESEENALEDNNAENDDQEFDIETSDGEEEDEEDMIGVENSYMEEKEEAVIALKEIAEHTGTSFAPYIRTSFEEIYKLLNYPNEDIRQSSVEALCQFVISLYKLNDIEGVKHTLLILVPKLSEIIHMDEERIVVMAALESFNSILEELGKAALEVDGHKDAIYSCVVDVLNGKATCQYEEPEEDDEDESEYDIAIMESAGEILPKFGKAMTSQEFFTYFSRIFPFFIGKIQKTKNKDEMSQSQRAMAVGVVSECFEPLGEFTAQYFDNLLPLFIDLLNDRSDEEVRNNAVYAIGEMVVHGGQTSFKCFPQILEALSTLVAKESHGGILDNICGTLGRLIFINSSLVPLKDVLPVFISYLPLRQDYVENEYVFRALDLIYRQGNEVLLQFLERVILTALTVLSKKQYSKDEVRDHVFTFVKQVRNDFPEKFNNVVNADSEISSFVQSLS